MFNFPDVEMLKAILESSLQPQSLDVHPWAKKRFVLDAVANNPELKARSPGQQLLFAIEELFPRMMPSTPPRRGKRLDTHWGEFGILAAQYFAPLAFGTPQPATLRDAWGRIDQSILLFVYGKSADMLSQIEKETYKLVGDEPGVASNSTLSDWHRKGLQRLAERILARESYLSKKPSKSELIDLSGRRVIQTKKPLQLTDAGKGNIKTQKKKTKRFVLSVLGFTLLSFILITGYKAWRVHSLIMLVRQDAVQMQGLITSQSPRLERLEEVGPALSTLRHDFDTLNSEVEPYLWLGPWLKWVPVYGGDLASVQDLITMVDSLLVSADISYRAILPMLEENGLSDLTPPRLTEFLVHAHPQLTEALLELDLAAAARSRLVAGQMSPDVRNLILNDIDPLITLMQDGLIIATELPRLMGATDEGPKTYLLLVQNEDELRPTGGFITAAGTLLVQDGEIKNLTFENSGDLDNWSMPYPVAPWQLSQYMNSRVLIFRDANWFTSYPTAALYAEYLYSYHNAHSVDGVIAFDQQMLVEVLSVVGPLALDGVPYPIDSSNVIAYMRSAKTPTAEELASPDWSNKAFIEKIAGAIFAKIFNGDVQWEALSSVLLRVLNERHLLLQLDNPTITSSILARHNWDGAIHPEDGDFLMVVDTNVGFNKTNAVVEEILVYDVDLTQPFSPTSSLTVVHKNRSVGVASCKHWGKVRAIGEKDYPITDCYWNYLRVYTAGASLLDATPQSVPADWMILNQSPPVQVDILDEEIDGIQVFGTLQVVPGGQSLATSFEFSLPPGILEKHSETGLLVYRLKVKKQPGTLAVPITIRVHLSNDASIETAPSGAIIQDHNVLYQTDLRTDLEFEVVFHVP